MRADELPRESAPLLEGATKAAYALDANGRYVIVPNGGTEAEITVTEEAVAWFEQQARDARRRVHDGRSSPLEYHMYCSRHDLASLAQATGFWRWRVRRHLRADVFPRLSPQVLSRYADAMGMTVEQVVRID